MDVFPRKLDLLDDVDMRFCRKIYKAHGVLVGTYDYDYSDSLSVLAGYSANPGSVCFRSKSILCAGYGLRDSVNRARRIGRFDFMRGLPSAGFGEAGECFDFFEGWCRVSGVDVIEFSIDIGLGRVSARDRWVRSRGYKEGFRLYVKDLSHV